MAEETKLEQNTTEAASLKEQEQKPEKRTPRIDFKIGNFGDFGNFEKMEFNSFGGMGQGQGKSVRTTTQIINGKKFRKYDSIDLETNTVNYNNTINKNIKNIDNYFSRNESEKGKKDKEKENEKVDYEINIINENRQGKLINEEKNDIDIILPLDKEFHGKENTNSNILINDIES